MSSLYRGLAFRADAKNYTVKYEHLSDLWLSTLEIGTPWQKSSEITVLLTEALSIVVRK